MIITQLLWGINIRNCESKLCFGKLPFVCSLSYPLGAGFRPILYFPSVKIGYKNAIINLIMAEQIDFFT